MNDLVREIYPLWLRDHFHQVLFDVLWVIGLGELKASRDAMNVSIHHDAHTAQAAHSPWPRRNRAKHQLGRASCRDRV